MRRWFWPNCILIAVLIVVSFLFWDESLSIWFANPAREDLWLAARNITEIGLGEFWFALAAIVYVVTRWVKKSENGRLWSIQLFWSLMGSGLALQIIKATVGRQRPHVGETIEAHVFNPLTVQSHFHSFPSGHTQVLFTVATCLGFLWPRAVWLFYVVAGALSFTRVMTLQHFLSDVFGGILTGVLGTLLVRWALKRRWKVAVPISELPKNH